MRPGSLRGRLRRPKEHPRSERRNANAALLELAREGPAPTASRPPSSDGPWRVAVLIPDFRRGSGGHATIAHLLEALRHRGHELSLWLIDTEGRHLAESEPDSARLFHRYFGLDEVELHTEFSTWKGADIVLATGWQTVAPALLVPGAGARAYLVQDHEPDFYGASAESLWARSTYSRGLHCIAASAWLAELLRERYGASASHFDLAIDHALYGVRDTPRRANRVIFYTRPVTARRAVPLGLLALEELARRRPEVEVVLYGDVQAPALAFPHVHMGVLTWQRLAALYAEATVGMVLSLTNPSLVGLEMMACGLPTVELASDSMLASFGRDGPLTLTEADPLALAGAIESLLDDAPLRGRLGAAGIELVARRSWERAAEQVEDGLRIALAKPPS